MLSDSEQLDRMARQVQQTTQLGFGQARTLVTNNAHLLESVTKLHSDYTAGVQAAVASALQSKPEESTDDAAIRTGDEDTTPVEGTDGNDGLGSDADS